MTLLAWDNGRWIKETDPKDVKLPKIFTFVKWSFWLGMIGGVIIVIVKDYT